MVNLHFVGILVDVLGQQSVKGAEIILAVLLLSMKQGMRTNLLVFGELSFGLLGLSLGLQGVAVLQFGIPFSFHLYFLVTSPLPFV